MKMMNFLQKNSNSFGHLVMSVAFLIFLGVVILINHDTSTVTFAASMMTMLFGYWFGSQSTAIKHVDAADSVKATATIAAGVVTATADLVAHPANPQVDPQQVTQKLPKVQP